MKTAVITAPACDGHQTDGHIEAVQRRLAVMARLEADGLLADRPLLTPEAATDDELARVHSPHYVRQIGAWARAGGGWLDYDTIVAPGSDAGARAAAGAARLALDRALSDDRRALAIVRPPGHHALPARGMGFCLYNSVAVAAAHALAVHRVERLLIVDWDVHHGNGTQAIFDHEPRVCFFSIHQWPHYPGSGLVEEMGEDAGLGTTVNVPVPARTGDAGYLRVFDEVLAPLARRYRPQVVLVSAGYDAHEDDPLGATRVTTAGFAAMTRRVVDLADELCQGRVAFALEGGYNLGALADSVAATLRVSDGATVAEIGETRQAPADDRLVGPVIAQARHLHRLD